VFTAVRPRRPGETAAHRGRRRQVIRPHLGDACAWTGTFLAGIGSWPSLVSVISPLITTYLLVRGSGKRLTEKRMITSRPGYSRYAARTSSFIPLPPRRPDRAAEGGQPQ
jgi:steroid 5-alpha reductase family enzyme